MYGSEVNIFSYIPHVPAASQCVGSHHLGSTETPEPQKTTRVGWLTTFFNQSLNTKNENENLVIIHSLSIKMPSGQYGL